MAMTFDQLPPELQAAIPAAARGSIVDVVPAPGGGYIAVGKDGGIFNLGGSKYYGSIPGLQGDTLAGQHTIGAGGLQFNANGGYRLTDSGGREYNFGPQGDIVQPNSLYSDPAFLAFVRGADSTIETAAADVARRQRAYNDALAASVTALHGQRDQALQGVDNSLESRGVFRSGRREVDRANQESNYANQIAQQQQNTLGQIEDLHSGLAGKVAEIQQQAAEKGFNTAQNQDLDQRLESLRKKYPAEFGATTKA